MKKIVEKYKEWKKNKDDSYIYDEIYSFLELFSRGDIDDFMHEVEKLYDLTNKTSRGSLVRFDEVAKVNSQFEVGVLNEYE